MPAEQIESRAKQKMESSANSILGSTITGYTTVREKSKQISILNRDTNYGLMPVWRYVYEYNKQEYPFYVNGETGKIVGTAPLSKKKVLFYSATLWFLLTVLLASINGILGLV